jgi:hypothetical protein
MAATNVDLLGPVDDFISSLLFFLRTPRVGYLAHDSRPQTA